MFDKQIFLIHYTFNLTQHYSRAPGKHAGPSVTRGESSANEPQDGSVKQVMGRLEHQNLWGACVVTHMGWLITAARSGGVGAHENRKARLCTGHTRLHHTHC